MENLIEWKKNKLVFQKDAVTSIKNNLLIFYYKLFLLFNLKQNAMVMIGDWFFEG